MNCFTIKTRVRLAWYFRVWAADSVNTTLDWETKGEALDRWERLWLTGNLDTKLDERFKGWLLRNHIFSGDDAAEPGRTVSKFKTKQGAAL